MGEANHWRINITCPRCGYNADVEETFPCGHEKVVAELVDALEYLLQPSPTPVGRRAARQKAKAALALAGKP